LTEVKSRPDQPQADKIGSGVITVMKKQRAKEKSQSVPSTTSTKDKENKSPTIKPLTIKRDNIVRVSPDGKNSPERPPMKVVQKVKVAKQNLQNI